MTKGDEAENPGAEEETEMSLAIPASVITTSLRIAADVVAYKFLPPPDRPVDETLDPETPVPPPPVSPPPALFEDEEGAMPDLVEHHSPRGNLERISESLESSSPEPLTTVTDQLVNVVEKFLEKYFGPKTEDEEEQSKKKKKGKAKKESPEEKKRRLEMEAKKAIEKMLQPVGKLTEKLNKSLDGREWMHLQKLLLATECLRVVNVLPPQRPVEPDEMVELEKATAAFKVAGAEIVKRLNKIDEVEHYIRMKLKIPEDPKEKKQREEERKKKESQKGVSAEDRAHERRKSLGLMVGLFGPMKGVTYEVLYLNYYYAEFHRFFDGMLAVYRDATRMLTPPSEDEAPASSIKPVQIEPPSTKTKIAPHVLTKIRASTNSLAENKKDAGWSPKILDREVLVVGVDLWKGERERPIIATTRRRLEAEILHRIHTFDLTGDAFSLVRGCTAAVAIDFKLVFKDVTKEKSAAVVAELFACYDRLSDLARSREKKRRLLESVVVVLNAVNDVSILDRVDLLEMSRGGGAEAKSVYNEDDFFAAEGAFDHGNRWWSSELTHHIHRRSIPIQPNKISDVAQWIERRIEKHFVPKILALQIGGVAFAPRNFVVQAFDEKKTRKKFEDLAEEEDSEEEAEEVGNIKPEWKTVLKAEGVKWIKLHEWRFYVLENEIKTRRIRLKATKTMTVPRLMIRSLRMYQ